MVPYQQQGQVYTPLLLKMYFFSQIQINACPALTANQGDTMQSRADKQCLQGYPCKTDLCQHRATPDYTFILECLSQSITQLKDPITPHSGGVQQRQTTCRYKLQKLQKRKNLGTSELTFCELYLMQIFMQSAFLWKLVAQIQVCLNISETVNLLGIIYKTASN